jgi:hypothetical protein
MACLRFRLRLPVSGSDRRRSRANRLKRAGGHSQSASSRGP